MNIKEQIIDVLQKELEPWRYRYIRSANEFKRKINKDISVYLQCDASRRIRGFTTVVLNARAEFPNIEKTLHSQNTINNIEYWHFNIFNRLKWMMPEDLSSPLWDFVFRDDDTEEVVNERLERMAWCIRIYIIPYLEKLSHRSSALEEAIALDQRFLLGDRFLVPVMYCVWKHDKKAALDYIEEKRLWELSFVEPGEWDRLEKMKRGETLTPKERPTHALLYEEYVEESKKIKEWIESLNYD